MCNRHIIHDVGICKATKKVWYRITGEMRTRSPYSFMVELNDAGVDQERIVKYSCIKLSNPTTEPQHTTVLEGGISIQICIADCLLFIEPWAAVKKALW